MPGGEPRSCDLSQLLSRRNWRAPHLAIPSSVLSMKSLGGGQGGLLRLDGGQKGAPQILLLSDLGTPPSKPLTRLIQAS